MPSPIRRQSPPLTPRSQRIGFDSFEADLRSGELRKSGSRIRLQAQPFQLLVLLLRNAGEVVTREEICRELWPADTFVDFEHSLPAAVNKIREALGDSAEEPKYIETLPKRGYRFVGKVNPEAPAVMPSPENRPPLEAAPDGSTRLKVRWGRIVALLAVAGGLGAAILLAILLVRPSSNSLDSQPLTVVPFTSYVGQETAPSLSPDGSRIAFAWDHGTTRKSGAPAYDLYVKAIGSETLLRLTNHPSDWISSAWSPDGTQIAFHRLAGPDTGIYVVPVLGGPERKLRSTRAPYDLASELNWSPDGKWIAYADIENGPGDRVFLLNTETLEAHEFPHDPSCNHEGTLTFSHSGKQFALLCVHTITSFEYFVSNLEGTSKRSLAKFQEFPTSLAWAADDKYLVISRSFASPELCEIRVSDGALRKIPVSPSGIWPALSRDGKKLAFTTPTNHVNIWRRDLLHPDAAPVQTYTSTLEQDEAAYSPDGKRVVFDSARSGVWSVWMADVDGGNLQQISHDRAAGFPRWSPDSQKIAFQMEDEKGIWAVYVAGTPDLIPHKLNTNIHQATNPNWSRDGKWIYFRGYEGVGHQIYRCPAEGGKATLMAASQDLDEPVESTDGKLLYFLSREAVAQLMTIPVNQPSATPQPVPEMPNVAFGHQWAPAANGIYFTPSSAPRSLSFYDFASKRVREVFHTDRDLAGGISLSPDGRYLLYSQLDENNSTIMLVTNFH